MLPPIVRDDELFSIDFARIDRVNPTAPPHLDAQHLRTGMVGLGMIFDETYCPFFESVARRPLYDPKFGVCEVALSAAASRTGRRAESLFQRGEGAFSDVRSFHGAEAVANLLAAGVDVVCIATPDDRHFAAARAALEAGKHVLIEKPSVLDLRQLDELDQTARQQGVLAKVVYHKLLDPDHKKLRTLVADGELQHVNNGYSSLLEPKSIAGLQFAEWIAGRNPGTYVAVHYIKLIDFTFGLKLKRISCTGQRGIVGPAEGPTWDSTQLRLIYEHADGREAAFDIHTSWVTPENFPGYVEQEVQFRFDNGVWLGHSRKRGVECTIEERTPLESKITLNNHYNANLLEPWGERAQRGYGIDVIERFMRETAHVEFGGPAGEREHRLAVTRALAYNDVSADRQVVAAVQAMEAILSRHAAGTPDCVAYVNDPAGGLVLRAPGRSDVEVLYAGSV
jgi:predicted dehydrogenase